MATKRNSYTLEFKLKVIREVRDGKKKKDVCEEYKIAPSTLSMFLKDQKQLSSAQELQKFHAKTKKMRRANHDDLNKAVFCGLSRRELWVHQSAVL